jgi:hypothetical protein
MSTDAYAPVRTGKPLPPLVPRNKEVAQETGTAFETLGAATNVTSLSGTDLTAEATMQNGMGMPAATSTIGETGTSNATPASSGPSDIVVIVNGQAKVLKGKSSYLLVDVLDVVSFNLADARGRQPVVNVNGVSSTFMKAIQDGDVIELAWKS